MDVSNENDIRYYELLEQLMSAMTAAENPDIPLIEKLLQEISSMFRLSKAVTHVYRTPLDEKKGDGETLCCYDTGREGEPIITLRMVSSIMSIVTMTVYMTADTKPLTEDERMKVEMVMRTTISFVSNRRLNKTVYELAYFDDSGYPNLRSLNRSIEKMIHRGTYTGKAAVRYNLRHFSLINQEIGRNNGDIVISNHFNAMRSIIGTDGEAFRLGGDNFVAIFTQDKLVDIIDFLTESTIPYGNEGNSVHVATSAGIFVLPDGFVVRNHGDVMEKIISAYQYAQNGGSDHIVLYDETIIQKKEKTMRVQQLFPDALRNEEFHVFYQPKINIKTGVLCGAEALCRWFKNGQIVPPYEFIPMLEETNGISRLDLYMLDHVCSDIRRWLDSGLKVVRISVNLSRKHMMNANLLQTLLKIIDSHNIPHEYIEIELTETTTDVEFRDLKRVVNGLQQVGIHTSVDDFGMGYSSLNLIREIPWDVLKIDRSFLPIDEDDSQNGTRSIMFRYVVAMAKNMGLECIAEGVETQNQLDILRENQCDLAQGFLFDPPLPVEKFEERMKEGIYPLYYSDET